MPAVQVKNVSVRFVEVTVCPAVDPSDSHVWFEFVIDIGNGSTTRLIVVVSFVAGIFVDFGSSRLKKNHHQQRLSRCRSHFLGRTSLEGAKYSPRDLV
jgi:hypothetical protein